MSIEDTEMRFLGYVALGAVGGCIHYAASSAAILPKSIFFGIVASFGLCAGFDAYRRFLIRDRRREIEIWRKGYASRTPVASDSVFYLAASMQYVMPSLLLVGVAMYCWYEAKAEELARPDSLLQMIMYVCIAAAIVLPAGKHLREWIISKSAKFEA